jgi:hypothetical protein
MMSEEVKENDDEEDKTKAADRGIAPISATVVRVTSTEEEENDDE